MKADTRTDFYQQQINLIGVIVSGEPTSWQESEQ